MGSRWLAAILLLSACASGGGGRSTTARGGFDLVVKNGTVIDGTGGPPYRADVGIIGDRIAEIGSLANAPAKVVIDAAGLIVAPGFINIHSHATDLRSSGAHMLQQGVTTEILNPDGGGNVSVARRLAALDSGLMLNAGAYVPFNGAWLQVVGNTDRRPTRAEIDSMSRLLDRGLAEGAWGVSAGLDYKPGYYATTAEVVDILRPLRAWRTNFPNHDRLTPENNYSSLAGIRETIEIGERAGLVPVITHMKLQGHEQGRVDDALAMMRAATERGVYTAADVYPYLAGQSTIAGLLVPAWAVDGGRPALVNRLRDPATRQRIARETEAAMMARLGSAENVFVIERNQTLARLMPVLGTTSPGEAVARILETSDAPMIATFGAEPDLVGIMRYPDAAIACDCGAAQRSSHPRYYGSFPRVLGRYTRETHALSWTEAVRKMTALPASIIGMVDRGLVAVGMAADLAIFDSTAIADRATYEQPMTPSLGMRFVVVNGVVALRDGQPTNVLSGRALRRAGASMPSRPMTTHSTSRSIRERGDSVEIDLRQSPGARSAEGHIRIGTFESTRLGVLQTAKGWASLTGRGKIGAMGAERAFTLIIDAGTPAMVFLEMEGMPPRSVQLRR